jgi:hypothetical protein
MKMYRLQRVDLTERVQAEYQDGADSYWLGEESRWLLNVPLVYRALATPAGGTSEFIRAPQRGDDFSTGGTFAYWGSLLHLLVYSFGWSVPALGMRWWFDAGFPVEDDDRLALLSQVWRSDGQLDWFAAYLWTFPLNTGGSTLSPTVQWIDVQTPRDWLDRVKREVKASGIPAPYAGGDPLHLSSHILNLIHSTGEQELTLTLDASGEPRGILMADSLAGWFAYLHNAPELHEAHRSGRSWRIDVVVKSVGWLGTSRRSRETGRWFAGPHRHHIVGCA